MKTYEELEKENAELKRQLEERQKNTISVDECLNILTGLVKLNVDKNILNNAFSCMEIKTPEAVLFYEEIKEAFVIVAIAKAFGIGHELNDYLINSPILPTKLKTAESLIDIKAQPDKELNVNKIVKRIHQALSTNIFSSTLNKNF